MEKNWNFILDMRTIRYRTLRYLSFSFISNVRYLKDRIPGKVALGTLPVSKTSVSDPDSFFTDPDPDLDPGFFSQSGVGSGSGSGSGSRSR